ncbi:MAG TPA: hypothetical protein VL221_00685 [Bacteroidota bacterium]|nr:hypothetical protein [Bacteroidota bacterium]
MAAQDMFDAFTAGLPERDREALRDVIRARREDMLAARSEEARVRLAEAFIRETRALVRTRPK